jgi:hypothetical protein
MGCEVGLLGVGLGQFLAFCWLSFVRVFGFKMTAYAYLYF